MLLPQMGMHPCFQLCSAMDQAKSRFVFIYIKIVYNLLFCLDPYLPGLGIRSKLLLLIEHLWAIRSRGSFKKSSMRDSLVIPANRSQKWAIRSKKFIFFICFWHFFFTAFPLQECQECKHVRNFVGKNSECYTEHLEHV